MAVVAEQHRRWWGATTPGNCPSHLIVQPENRGTGNGILLSTLAIAAADPNARILFIPADHHVRNEAPLTRALADALVAPACRTGIVLLGLEPEEVDSDLGYIVPEGPVAVGEMSRVDRFAEKPSPVVAEGLIARGALCNSFIFAGDVASILGLLRSRYSKVVDDLETAMSRDGAAVADLYECLPTIDFSRDVLQGSEVRLRVLRVARCGWSDLGTPSHLIRCLERGGDGGYGVREHEAPADVVNLAAVVAPLRSSSGGRPCERPVRR